MNPPSHDAEGGKQNVFKKGLDKFTAKMMVQKVQSRMETSTFPVMSESEQPGVSSPWVKDWHKFSYMISLT